MSQVLAMEDLLLGCFVDKPFISTNLALTVCCSFSFCMKTREREAFYEYEILRLHINLVGLEY